MRPPGGMPTDGVLRSCFTLSGSRLDENSQVIQLLVIRVSHSTSGSRVLFAFSFHSLLVTAFDALSTVF